MIEDRLRQLRLARGLSLEALAAELGGIVTKQALSKYEKGKAKPSPVVLVKLATSLGVKTSYLLSNPSGGVEFHGFRKRSRLPKKEQERVESIVRQELEDRLRLQDLTGQLAAPDLPVLSLAINSVEEAENAADRLRKLWGLGSDPIANVVDTLESHSVEVVEIDADQRFDGISAVAFDQNKRKRAAAVISRQGLSGERQRFNLAHELGHLVLKLTSESIDKEKAADRFAAAFLAPHNTIRNSVGVKRAYVSSGELLLLKKRFGMSIQALLFRLRDLQIINESHYKWWCIEISQIGWRKQEPEPLQPERPQWMHRTVLRLLAEELISHEEAERMLKSRIEFKEPLPLVERRAFMKLPIEQRRRILEEQAEKVAEHYRNEKPWGDLPEDDIIDY
jgi:Zn-dependent peptidase ImmA (M78 family)/transcriptional regulator with XRE-family HTH domain